MAGAEQADYADIQLLKLVKIRQQQNHAGCWWHSCLSGREGRKNPFPDVSIDVEKKNQLFRRISPDWRLFLTWKVFHFYDKQRTVLPRLGVAWPVWDLIENHDAIQCDVTKRSSANIQVKRHPYVFQKSPPHDLRQGNIVWFQPQTGGKKKRQNKNAQISARRVGSSGGHPHCGFAFILIFIQ